MSVRCRAVASILDVRRWPDVRETFSWDALWPLVDGDRARLNLAHECVDRHAGDGVALRLAHADGRLIEHSFRELAAWSSRFANLLEAEGVGPGERVAIMLEPSLAFYGALFGAVKRGAVAVPLFTLFGPDGVALRVNDCRPRLLLVERDAERWQAAVPGVRVIALDEDFAARLAEQDARRAPRAGRPRAAGSPSARSPASRWTRRRAISSPTRSASRRAACTAARRSVWSSWTIPASRATSCGRAHWARRRRAGRSPSSTRRARRWRPVPA